MTIIRTKRLIPILCAIALTHAGGIAAQCATSVNTGGGNCVPPDALGMPGYNAAQAPAPPAPKWKDTWGAIVIDSEAGSAGTVTNRDSKKDAIRDAMHDCQSHGATGCKVELTYFSQCAAIAWGKGGHGIANGPDTGNVEENAIRSCDESAKECKIVYSACSPARRVN